MTSGYSVPCPRNSKPPSSFARCLEHVDERGADDLPLLLRIGDAGEAIEEQIGRVHEVERQVQLLAEALLDLIRLVVAQQPVVHEDARQPIADGPVNQHRGDGGIDAARQPAHDLARPDLLPDALGRLLDERGDRPVARAAADVVGEVPQDLGAVIGVHDFGMEQQRVELTLRRLHRHDRRRGARGRDLESRRHGRHVVAVARPDPQLRRDLREELGACVLGTPVARYAHERVTELTLPRAPHFPAEHVGHQLHAVADAEHGRAEVEQRRVALRRALVRDALRPAGEDDPHRISGAQRLERRVERHDLGVDRQLAQPARDELRVLRAEVQDENGLMRHLGRPRRQGSGLSVIVPPRRGYYSTTYSGASGSNVRLIAVSRVGLVPARRLWRPANDQDRAADHARASRRASVAGLSGISTIRRRRHG